jgi:hypothetical protein
MVFALSRWPNLMPLNFSLAYAIAFCAGAFPRRLHWAPCLAVLVLTDVLKNVLYYHWQLFSVFSLINYLAFTALFFLGRTFKKCRSTPKLASGGLLGALLFYLVTNTGAWLQNPEYSKGFLGWIQALTVGTSGWPQTWEFFRNTLLSGGLFTALLAATFHATEPEVSEAETETEDESETAGNPSPESNIDPSHS